MRKKYWLALGLLAALLLRGLWENTALETNTYLIEDSRIPSGFDGLRIAQVSDLHNGHMGPSNAQVLEALKAAEPDVILLTGDLIDSRHRDIAAVLEFAREAVKLAPVYSVTGNHEARGGYAELQAGLEKAGVILVDNEKVRLHREGDTLLLLGLQDPAFPGPEPEKTLAELTAGETAYTILLCHRPELFEITAQHADLVFSGHAHGGQLRLPLLGGLIAPGQGLLPGYDAGLFRREESLMLLSRGVGNSLLPLRLGNKPEIVVAELKTIQSQ